ncbi:MAG: tannase/feruloyl esterase family alpha/beta hydrolase [Sedimentisphaerales bacterium]|nr:tannase/feruloyl esterase family alpha/beta hydrolase [Sedimentisphaerales bacterium]
METKKNAFIISFVTLITLVIFSVSSCSPAPEPIAAPGSKLPVADENIIITQEDVTVEKVGTSIPVSAIGEPVSEVTLSEPRWVAGATPEASSAIVEGAIMPVDPCGYPINFRVVLPASWNRRAIQQGGGGMNGTITVGGGGGFGARGGASVSHEVMYGSDSGHQAGGGMMGGMMGGGMMGGRGAGTRGAAPAGSGNVPGRGGVPGAAMAPAPGARGGMRGGGMMGGGMMGGSNAGNAWALNDEAIKNLGYMQMKKTHDAAMVIIERIYGERPRFSYYIGGSQGGREALTVAQRYPNDYDGILADVPIVNFSSLMLAPELIRIQEKPQDNWVTPAKVNAIRTEFIRQCDGLDGLVDGIINNYAAARKLFDVTDGVGTTDPWAALRAPDGVDPNPSDSSASAKLTNGQIDTLEFVYSRYKFATPLANGVKTFGMWVPNTDVSGSGLIESTRYQGQEGAPANARNHSHMGVLGVTGFLMQDLSANPLDYVEGGKYNKRREEISEWLDSTNPDLTAFYKSGGKMIVNIGTNDSLASPGAQLDYYQSVIDKMGQDKVDAFARLFVLPQTGHGLSGNSFATNGDGQSVQSFSIPNQYDKRNILFAWVEKNEAPDKTLVVTSGNRSLPLCSYPNYPKYIGGPVESASSYESTAP